MLAEKLSQHKETGSVQLPLVLFNDAMSHRLPLRHHLHGLGRLRLDAPFFTVLALWKKKELDDKKQNPHRRDPAQDDRQEQGRKL